jgi:hypothetical protein
MKAKLDKTYVGIIFGAILPIIGFFAFWQFKFDSFNLSSYIDFLMADKVNRNNPLVFSMIPNLALFYFSNFQFKWFQFTVGLVGVTLLYTIPIVISLI